MQWSYKYPVCTQCGITTLAFTMKAAEHHFKEPVGPKCVLSLDEGGGGGTSQNY